MRKCAGMRRFPRPGRCAFAAAAALAALLAILSVPASSQPDETVIHVGAGPDNTSLPLIYAAQSGMFQRAGLNVELEKLSGAAAVAAALAGGSLDVGKGSALSVVTAFAKGLPFTAIGSIAYYNAANPDVALIVLADSPYKGAKDLVGQTLADLSLDDMNTVATFAWLGQHGVDWKSLKYVEIPPPASLAAMEQNRVVGSTVYEPIFSADVATGKVRVLGYPFSAIGRFFTDSVLFSNVKWVDAHRELVGRFLRVVGQSSAYVSGHFSEALPMLAQYGGLDPSAIANSRQPTRGVVLTPADLQPVIDVAAKLGVIPNAFPAQSMICTCALQR